MCPFKHGTGGRPVGEPKICYFFTFLTKHDKIIQIYVGGKVSEK